MIPSNNLAKNPKLVKPMKNLKLKIILSFLLGMLLTACGGGGGGGGSDSDSSSTAADLSTPQGYFTARVSENIIQNKCITCHVSNGLAESTPLIYTSKNSPTHAEANFNTLQNYIQNEPSRAASMMQKVSGELAHDGGIQLAKNSSEYGYLKAFLEMVGGNTNISSKPVDDSSSGDDQANSGDQNQIADPVAYFASDISPDIIQGKCIDCHVSGGVAAATSLKYESTTTFGHLETNYQTISDYIESDSSNADLLLQKSLGASGHGGGAILSTSSEEHAKLKAFVESLGANVSQASPLPTGRFWEGVEEANREQTLRRAALIVSRRLPTEQEIETVKNGDDVALRATLKGLMQGEGFHDFLIQGANDRLHLKAFENGLFLEAADLNATPLFPLGAKKFFEAGDKSEGWPDWMNKWMWGMANSPLELIAYIVENDRSYQEVVTADYMMVNPVMDEILRSETGLNESNSHQEYRRGKNRGQIVPDDQLSSEFIQDFGHRVDSYGAFLDYPHAGILNSHAFLNRYPTTETNRNRARARWTYYHFLGLDIEKSASRTTDPVALADTNNPTMNNPACTVCHQVMDPAAGAYQNYGNAGLFRDSWGGMDALPDTYKHPEWFEENAEPSLYRHGDNWFQRELGCFWMCISEVWIPPTHY